MGCSCHLQTKILLFQMGCFCWFITEIAVNILGQGCEGKELYTCVFFLFVWSLCKTPMVMRQKFMVSKVLDKTLCVVICFILGRCCTLCLLRRCCILWFVGQVSVSASYVEPSPSLSVKIVTYSTDKASTPPLSVNNASKWYPLFSSLLCVCVQCVCVHVCVYECTPAWVCVFVCVWLSEWVCACMRVCTCMSVCICVCAFIVVQRSPKGR